MQLAVFTHSYSNYRYAILYSRQDKICFADSHIKYFAHVGGVVREMVYDNMRVVVSKFISRSKKEPTELLLELSGHYQFGWRFCNARKGNEKGHVERSVEFIRRKSFCHIDEFPTMEAANKHLFNVVKKINTVKSRTSKCKSPSQLFSEEILNMPLSPTPYNYFQTEFVRVDKYSTIKYQQNSYSVPDIYVGKLLNIHIYPEQIIVFNEDEKVCVHSRSYKLHDWKICLEHYLHTLKQKPGALHSSIALKQTDKELKAIYNRWFTNNPKEFIELLQYAFKNNIKLSDVYFKAKEVAKITHLDVSKEKIMVLLENKIIYTSDNEAEGEIERFSITQINLLNQLLTNNKSS